MHSAVGQNRTERLLLKTDLSLKPYDQNAPHISINQTVQTVSSLTSRWTSFHPGLNLRKTSDSARNEYRRTDHISTNYAVFELPWASRTVSFQNCYFAPHSDMLLPYWLQFSSRWQVGFSFRQWIRQFYVSSAKRWAFKENLHSSYHAYLFRL